MTIREIREEDIPAILELVAGTMDGSPRAYVKEYGAALNDRMRRHLEHPARSAQYVAMDRNRVAGFVLAGIPEESDLPLYYFMDHANPREPLSWVLLGQITVDAGYRGSGFGSELLARVEQRARELNLKGVYTGTRGTLREFYEKNGFEIDKVYLKKPVSRNGTPSRSARRRKRRRFESEV